MNTIDELYEALREMSMSYEVARAIIPSNSVAADVIIGAFGDSPEKANEALKKFSRMKVLKERSNHEAYMISLRAGDALTFHETFVPRP